MAGWGKFVKNVLFGRGEDAAAREATKHADKLRELSKAESDRRAKRMGSAADDKGSQGNAAWEHVELGREHRHQNRDNQPAGSRPPEQPDTQAATADRLLQNSSLRGVTVEPVTPTHAASSGFRRPEFVKPGAATDAEMRHAENIVNNGPLRDAALVDPQPRQAMSARPAPGTPPDTVEMGQLRAADRILAEHGNKPLELQPLPDTPVRARSTPPRRPN